ncbi:hypothetical protein D3C79_692500 [compost metagenome]
MRRPVVDDGGEHRFRPEVRHVRSVAHGIHAATFGGLDWRRAVGVLEHHVHALVDQRVGGIGFLARVEPGVDPHHLDFGAGVVFVQGKLDGIYIAQHFRNREGGDIADLLALGHFRGQIAANVTAFVGCGQVSTKVLVLLVAGSMFESDLRELLGDFGGGVHVAERGSEHQVVAALGHVADDPLGIGAFWHVLDEAAVDLVTELLDQGLAALLMLIGPAMVADRADIDEADFQRVGGGGGQGGAQANGGSQGAQQVFAFVVRLQGVAPVGLHVGCVGRVGNARKQNRGA